MHYRESVYDRNVDRFDFPDLVQQIMRVWKSIPQDQKSLIVSNIRDLWPVRGMLLAHLTVLVFGQVRHGVPLHIAIRRAAQKLKIEQQVGTNKPGMSSTQAQQYRRRQMQRLPSDRSLPGYRPRRR